MKKELIEFLLRKGVIKTSINAYQGFIIIKSEVFKPTEAWINISNAFALAYSTNYVEDVIRTILDALENGDICFSIDTEYDEDNEELNELLKSLGAKMCGTEDGARGFMEDVTQEDWYKEPPMTLYDELEYDCYELICKYAKLLGIYLTPEEVDFDMAKSVQETVMEKVEEAFGIPFPVYEGR